MFNILRRIKNKRGDAFILTMGAMMVAFLFVILIIDFGFGFINKVQLQNISDAAAIGGADNGKQGYYSVVNNSMIGLVNESTAKSTATGIIKSNEKYLMDRASITGYSFNPSGKKINGRNLNSRDQYYSGNFTVEMAGKYKAIFLSSKLFNNVQIPYLTYHGTSRVHVTPIRVP